MRSLNKADKIRGKRIQAMGCIVCLEVWNTFSPAHIHHMDGQTKKGCHELTIGLCNRHHQNASDTGLWATRHGPGRNAGKYCFESTYGTELELLEKVNKIIEELDSYRQE